MKPTVVRDPRQAVPLKVWDGGGAVPMEPEALAQARNVCTLPFVFRHVALMPDAHLGKGATVGSVIPTTRAIIPAAVGVDLGCGMVAAATSLTANDLPDDLSAVRGAIEAAVPHGRTDRGARNDRGAWRRVPAAVSRAWTAGLARDYDEMCDRHPKASHRRPVEQLGTLGTGNHFIEVCLDETGRVWVMLHSGSRGPGNRIGSYFIEQAREEMRKRHVDLPDADLAYLQDGSRLFGDYVAAVDWAQRYAKANRDLMLDATLDALADGLGRARGSFTAGQVAIDCHHNYVAREQHFGEQVWVTRKGAVSARSGELGIVPGAMGRKSFVVRGKGNRESFASCSHGAGRVMSRTAARQRFTVADHCRATHGLECRKDADVIDETPAAYKDIDAVMAAQSELVEVVHTLRALVCVKG
jgi:tRNA-splicing ligase RtcB